MATLEEIRSLLGWCALIESALLLWWFAWFALARDTVRRLHGRWFRIDDERFDAIHYALMGAFKLAILVFALAPWIALHIAA